MRRGFVGNARYESDDSVASAQNSALHGHRYGAPRRKNDILFARKYDNSRNYAFRNALSWVLLNAGFDPKDVGAGFADYLDLTDYGDVKRINSATINDIKVGDLLHSYAAGGHIGIIVGIDNDYFYVAQALWYDEVGVIITKYKKELLYKSFPHVVLMDKYYINDGKLTNMWY